MMKEEVKTEVSEAFLESKLEKESKYPLIASPDEEDDDDDEPEDEFPQIIEDCKNSAECLPVKKKYDACAERVLNAENTEETCVEVIL